MKKTKTQPSAPKLNASQLRRSKPRDSQKKQKAVARNPIVLVLDNIYDTYNIGCFFRLADALAAQAVYLCGQVVTPPNIKIHRASIGTWKWVPWSHFRSTTDCLKQLKSQNFQIVACEQTPKSINYQKAQYQPPIALVLGNESTGVGDSSLKLCDLIVEIPIYGVNKSLNVLVAASIVSFNFLNKFS